MTYIYILQFLGTIISLTGALTIFLVGVVYADLWAAHRRTEQIIKNRQKEGLDISDEEVDKPDIKDPFEETYDED